MSHVPRVFTTQVPSKKDAKTNLWIPTVNINPASTFGEIIVLLPAGSQFYAAKEIVRVIKQRLNDEDYQPEDYFLPMGSPTVMAVAAAIMARRSNGCLNLLQWDNRQGDYSLFKLEQLL
jgi:hypothetical protein